MTFYIKERRLAKNMTQTTLAEKSGVSRSIINGLETGRATETTTTTIANIAKALGCSIDDLFSPQIV